MRKRDTFDVLTSLAAVVVDGVAVFGGLLLACYIKFDSGWLAVPRGRPENLYSLYGAGAAFATIVFLLVFRALGLYVRPQMGKFPARVPRLVKAVGIGVMLAAVLGFGVKNIASYSSHVLVLALGTVTFIVLLERWILFRVEWNLARHVRMFNRVVIVGTDAVAVRVRHAIGNEPMLRSCVTGFLQVDEQTVDPAIESKSILGTQADLPGLVESGQVDQVVLTGADLGRERTMALLLLCERHLVTFNLVPDIFRILTSSMDVRMLDDIPLLGVSRWPLDILWNRVLKRIEDIAGAMVGLVLSAPVMIVGAWFIKRSSPGPVFYNQERCGEHGRRFMLHKLRTMCTDAESASGPVFTQKGDRRVTPVGAFLRRHNLDELPQFWNVLKGEMSLVGPRPERPYFVEQFKSDISRYMRRHVSRPGMTGWAQVHGLRGNTSIEERIKYDLFYLENWSLGLDFKILIMTCFARENAY